MFCLLIVSEVTNWILFFVILRHLRYLSGFRPKCRATWQTFILIIIFKRISDPPKNQFKMSMMAYTASAAAARALVARSALRPVASQIGGAKMDVASTQGKRNPYNSLCS